MTNKQKETVLAGFQAAASGLRTDELPEWLLAKGRALPFYQKALTAGSADEAFLALYNAYGMMLGFRPGVTAMAEALGLSAREVRAMLARVRRDDGDTAPAEEKGPAPSAAQLAVLESGFRRLLLRQP